MKRALTMFARMGAIAGMCVALTSSASAQVHTIYQIQSGQGGPLEGNPVIVEDVVVVGTYLFGFFAQEQEPDPTFGWEFSGVWVYTQNAPEVERGEVVTLTGTYEEYFDETEVDVTGTGTVEVTGSADVPDPQLLTISDINDGAAKEENWEGVFVEVTMPNMVASDSLLSGCNSSPESTPTRWAVYQTSAPTNSLDVRNSISSHEKPPALSPINFIRGSMSYHRCTRKILPRDNEDVGYVGPPNLVWAYATSDTTADVVFSRDVTQASSETAGNYIFTSGLAVLSATQDADDNSLVHLTTMPQPNSLDDITVVAIQTEGGAVMPTPQAFSFRTNITPISTIQTVVDPGVDDASPLDGQTLTVAGVATSSNNGTGTNRFYMADAPGAWNGLYIDFIATTVDIGDSVLCAGRLQEGFGRTDLNFAGYSASFNLGPATVPIAPTDIPPAQLPYNNVALSEPFESVFVRLSEAWTDSIPGDSAFGEWVLYWPIFPDSSKYDVDADQEDSFGYVPCPGDVITVAGNVRFSFGQYHVLPRIGSDIAIQSHGPGCVVATGEVSVPVAMRLKNHPNPFNPSTTIEFEVPGEGQITLQVFDIKGSLVRTLVTDQAVEPGSFSVRWDGKDDRGTDVGSGTYFYRALLGELTVTNRMTLLK